MQAEIYSKPDCPYCVKAKALLTEKGIAYHEYIISSGLGEKKAADNQQYVTKADLLEKYPAAKTVPQIWLDGEHIGGYTELAAHFAAK